MLLKLSSVILMSSIYREVRSSRVFEDDFDPYVEDDDHLELQSPEPEKLEPQHQDYEHSPELQHQDHEQSSKPPKAQMPEPEQDEQSDTADTDTPLLESESKR